ncbi:enoyl-CoA hydratase/isomerase family protein [Actinomadura sp. SCN-SB]|uniref:enoyl-CoA hydratase/isomerase family protein n=1 Tax=Actinomadura sp. SCN-SB TaxID=3373092 RepID=UPI003753B017
MSLAVTYAREDGVAVITLNRPHARNALNRAVLDGLWEALHRFDADDDAKVMVLTGAGDAFCAGADLRELRTLGGREEMPDYPVLGTNIHVAKPVIAAVNGVAYGGGFVLAQMCDLCVAADHARFAVAEARWGRTMVGNAPLLPMIPPRVAMELFLTAEPIDAERAHQIGLVNRVFPAEGLREGALAMARVIAGNAPLSVRAAKAMVAAAINGPAKELRAVAEEVFAPVFASEDAREGPRAFAEGRPPRWTGR